MKDFPFYQQLDSMDCGPTCLKIITKYYGLHYSLQTLRERSYISREGVSLLGISKAAESIGFRARGVRVSFGQLSEDISFPCILHWTRNHFVVCYEIKRKRRNMLNRKSTKDEWVVKVSDPAFGLVSYSKEEFLKSWISPQKDVDETGVVLILEPTPNLYLNQEEKEQPITTLSYYAGYLKPYKREFIQLILSLIIGTVFQFILPFLTQSMIDTGVGNHNLNFITLVLVAQLVLFLTQLAVEFIRNWIVLHVNTRISISLISDFLAKLMRLPIAYFDTKMVGDTMQRIGDHARIRAFLTGSSLTILFSFVNFIVFGIILAYYDLTILCIFLIATVRSKHK